MSDDNNGKPPSSLHFLSALAHGALAVSHLAFGPNPDEEDEEAPPRRRRRIASGKRAGSGSCCNGSRRKKTKDPAPGSEK